MRKYGEKAWDGLIWLRLRSGFVDRLVPLDVRNFLTTGAIDKKVKAIRVQSARAHSGDSFLTSALDEVSAQNRAPAALLPKKNGGSH